MLSGESLLSIPFFLTTIPFWTRHNGDWFLDFILVAYLLAPLIRMVYDRTKQKLLVTVFFCTSFTLIGNSFFGALKTDNPIWYNISYIAQRFPGFFMGFYVASLMKERKSIPYWITLIGPAVCIVVLYLNIDIHLGWIIAFPAVVWLCVIFEWIKGRAFHNTLAWLGAISLESYLTNVYVANILSYTEIQKVFNGYPYYGVVIVVGLLLAACVNRAAKPIMKKAG